MLGLPITPVSIADLADILLVALLIHALLVWFKRTRSALVLTGLLLLGAVYIVARATHMRMTSWLFEGFFAVFVVAVVVIFQEELRNAFERIALWSLARRTPKPPAPREADILVRAASDLVRERVGALIVLRGRDLLDRHLEGGWKLNGELSEALIESIFDSHSLGHDGAMVIEGGRALQFGAHLPLSRDYQKVAHLGLRHTAALGLSEKTDALILVVSEERGVVSVARRGVLTEVSQLQGLHDQLQAFLLESAPRTPPRRLIDFLRQNALEKLLALALSMGLWWLFVGRRAKR